jgi:hypothetical protein
LSLPTIDEGHIPAGQGGFLLGKLLCGQRPFDDSFAGMFAPQMFHILKLYGTWQRCATAILKLTTHIPYSVTVLT